MNDNRGPKQQVQIPGTPVMVQGLKYEFHVQRHGIKRARIPFDAGFDIFADRSEPKLEVLADCALITVGTSFQMTPHIGAFGYLHERSSSLKKLNGGRVRSGVIDCGYTGELLIHVICQLPSVEQVLDGIKRCAVEEYAIAQVIMIPCLMPMFAHFDPKVAAQYGRGANGFGHTDIIAS